MTELGPTAAPIRPRIVPRPVRPTSRRPGSKGAPVRPLVPFAEVSASGEREPAPGLRRVEVRRGSQRLRDLLDLGDVLGLGAAVAAAILVLNFIGAALEEAPAPAGSGAVQASPLGD